MEYFASPRKKLRRDIPTNYLWELLEKAEKNWNEVTEWVESKQGALETKISDTTGSFPIHSVCSENAPTQVIQALLRANPQSAWNADVHGRLPIHLLCQFGAPIDSMLAMLSANQGGASKQDSDGMLPLHLACDRASPLEIIKLLLQIYPEGATTANNSGLLPIHIVCTLEDLQDFSTLNLIRAANILLEVYPQGAKCLDREEKLPLHHAVEQGSPLEVVQTVARTYPAGVAVPDAIGCLPMHLACRAECTTEVLAELLRMFPEATRICDPAGWIPLHYICEKTQFPQDVVRKFIDAYPESPAVKVPGEDLLPLHIACREGAPEGLVLVLLKSYPAAARTFNTGGSLPIHEEIKCHIQNPRKNVIQKLLDAYPQGALVPNREGNSWSKLLGRARRDNAN